MRKIFWLAGALAMQFTVSSAPVLAEEDVSESNLFRQCADWVNEAKDYQNRINDADERISSMSGRIDSLEGKINSYDRQLELLKVAAESFRSNDSIAQYNTMVRRRNAAYRTYDKLFDARSEEGRSKNQYIDRHNNLGDRVNSKCRRFYPKTLDQFCDQGTDRYRAMCAAFDR